MILLTNISLVYSCCLCIIFPLVYVTNLEEFYKSGCEYIMKDILQKRIFQVIFWLFVLVLLKHKLTIFNFILINMFIHLVYVYNIIWKLFPTSLLSPFHPNQLPLFPQFFFSDGILFCDSYCLTLSICVIIKFKLAPGNWCSHQCGNNWRLWLT